MRLPHPRFTVRQMMVTVAITGLLMGWVVHARSVLHEDEDFGFGVLLVECVGTLILSVFALPIVFAIYLFRQGDAYATQLRRDDVPRDVKLVAAHDRSPQAESS
jgi:hypothetical protein